MDHQQISALRINEARFRKDFDELAAIGGTPDGGAHRPAFGPDDLAARGWFRGKADEAGLVYWMDEAGNQFARLNCTNEDAATLLTGSHLDSVPNGGRFDGALGVTASLEAVRTIAEAGVELQYHLAVVNFSDEEGSHVGLMGSRALSGQLSSVQAAQPQSEERMFRDRLGILGLTPEGVVDAERPSGTWAGYLELHIEQGPRLLDAGIEIGIVSSIVGIRRFRIVFSGQANHAGTTPMNRRRDPGWAAAGFVIAARAVVLADYPECVMNIGRLIFKPGAYNVVPAEVEAALEFRAPDSEQFDRLEQALLAAARQNASEYGVEVELYPEERIDPAPMSRLFEIKLAEAVRELGLSGRKMPSGAGHDAQSMASVCPAGMIFVPSVRGVSHSPAEYTEWTDCINGANVMLQTLLKLASSTGA